MNNSEINLVKDMSAKLDKLINWLDYEIAHIDKKKTDKSACKRIEQNVLSVYETLKHDMDATLEEQMKTYEESQKTLEDAETLYNDINNILLKYNLGIIKVAKTEVEEVQVKEEIDSKEHIEINEIPSTTSITKDYTPKPRDSMITLTNKVNKFLSMKLNLDDSMI